MSQEITITDDNGAIVAEDYELDILVNYSTYEGSKPTRDYPGEQGYIDIESIKILGISDNLGAKLDLSNFDLNSLSKKILEQKEEYITEYIGDYLYELEYAQENNYIEDDWYE